MAFPKSIAVSESKRTNAIALYPQQTRREESVAFVQAVGVSPAVLGLDGFAIGQRTLHGRRDRTLSTNQAIA